MSLGLTTISSAAPDQVCEQCKREFYEGETTFGVITDVWDDELGSFQPATFDCSMLTDHLADYRADNWRCRECFTSELHERLDAL